MIESGGRGGVFNHSVEVVAGLRELGHDVVLHTTTDPDPGPPGLNLCRCITWYRRSSSRVLRQAATTGRYLLRTLPHLARVIRPGDVVHLQGMFALTPELISVARLRRATVVCSPHNTFARAGAPGSRRVLAHVLRRADRILVHSDADAAHLAGRHAGVGRVPLVQWVPPVSAELVAGWRAALAPGGERLAVMPGHVRRDKNAEVFVAAMGQLPGWRGAIIGEDQGVGGQIDALIHGSAAPVTTRYGYLDVDAFVALVAAADVVVAPYRVASQSGVLSVAARLGVPRATVPVGGLGELATAVALDLTPAAVRDAIIAAHETGAVPVATADAAGRFVEEYLVATTGAGPRPGRADRRSGRI
jgi:hypothetical protein